MSFIPCTLKHTYIPSELQTLLWLVHVHSHVYGIWHLKFFIRNVYVCYSYVTLLYEKSFLRKKKHPTILKSSNPHPPLQMDSHSFWRSLYIAAIRAQKTEEAGPTHPIPFHPSHPIPTCDRVRIRYGLRFKVQGLWIGSNSCFIFMILGLLLEVWGFGLSGFLWWVIR